MARNKFKLFLKIGQNRIIHHTLFWILSYFVLLNLFSNSSEITKVDYIYTSIFLLTLILVVYINLLVLIPQLLSYKKNFLYVVLLLTVLFVGSRFNMLLFNRFIDYILPGYYFISYYSFFDILKFSLYSFL